MKLVRLTFVWLVALALLGAARPSFASAPSDDAPIPVKYLNGQMRSSWDGSYSDLLAADALAQCWTTQMDSGASNFYSEGDGFITGLINRMNMASCYTTCPYSPRSYEDVQICAYMESRKDPYCNMDRSLTEYRAIDVSTLRASGSTSAYLMPSAATLGLDGGAQLAEENRNFAQYQASYADLSLCMAEQLRQKLDTAQVAFASGDDLARVQEMVRERSLTAVYQYTILSKIFSSTAVTGTGSGPQMGWWGMWTKRWRDFLTVDQFKRLGDDYMEAVKLLVEATESRIQYQLRQPQAQGSFGTPTWTTAEAFTGLSGPRADVVEKTLYDGYNKLDPYATRLRGVLTDASDPQVSTLLGFARAANALKLHVSGNPQFNSASNASTLLLAVENYVRGLDCAAHSILTCPLATATTPPSSFLLWQRYAIALNHAQTLVDTLTEAMFGPPTPSSRATGLWAYPPLFAGGMYSATGPAEALGLHLFGFHRFTGDKNAQYPTGDVIIDPKFSVKSLSANDIQSSRTAVSLPAYAIDPNGTMQFQAPDFRLNPQDADAYDTWGYPVGYRPLGSNTVLALARESLLQLSLSPAGSGAKSMYAEALPALGLIEKMIGTRQVTVRQTLVPVATPYACATCSAYTPKKTPVSTYIANEFNVMLLARATDPFSQIGGSAGIPLAGTLVQGDDSNTTIFGDTRASAIVGAGYSGLLTPVVMGDGTYNLRSQTFTWLANISGSGVETTPVNPRGMTVLIKTGVAPATYAHVFTGLPVIRKPFNGAAGTVVTFGGQFEREVNDAWAFDGEHWAVPKFDGFGLRHNWVPGSDASLFGDPPGTSVESHFLNRASIAAEDSAGALQQAFDTLQQQSLDETAAISSDARAKQLTNLEYTALCGINTTTCKASYSQMLPIVTACKIPGDPDCEAFRGLLGNLVGAPTTGPPQKGLPIASAVVPEIQSNNPAPTFAAFKGGTLQGLLLANWSAWRALSDSLNTAVSNGESAIANIVAAKADRDAAVTEYNLTIAAINTFTLQIEQASQQNKDDKAKYESDLSTYTAQATAAEATRAAECDPPVWENARSAGYSYSWEDGQGEVRINADGLSGQFYNSSYSPGAMISQHARCNDAVNQQALVNVQTAAQQASTQALLDGMVQRNLITATQQQQELPARKAAAEAHIFAASQRLGAAYAAAAVQQNGAAQDVQAAVSQLLSTVVAIDHAFTEADMGAARIAIDNAQANYDIRARFGVRNRFHSYDLWRARALTENARRLAVAARRAIEARYVVDLSAMNGVESFVEAPSVWADQIYSSDLKPFSIGLTENTSGGSGLYTNAVKDYVNNLKLFLDGFAVQRPSATVRSDTEVIELPGPATQVLSALAGKPFGYIDPASSGWAFFCPSTGTWISNPDFVKFTAGTPTWTLSKACAGSAPTMARLNFGLDPWGRLNGNTAQPPYAARYNVRAKAIALNLVGSGIRSCQNTADPAVCYGEPFVRYDLEHVGPAWVTSYDQTWHSLSIPVAVAEGGKALAIEEWLDPVSNGFNRPDVVSVTRDEFDGRPIGGSYQLTLKLTPDINIERIERIQVLTQTAYWVRQQ